jgi:hypothetical protein
MTTPEDAPPLTPEQKLTAVANAGGDLVAAAFQYAAEAATWNLASRIESGEVEWDQ